MSWVKYWSDDVFDRDFWQPRAAYYFKNLTGIFHLSPQLSVMDYGSGPGYMGPLLAERVGRVYLVEPSLFLHKRSLEVNLEHENAVSLHLEDPYALRDSIGSGALDIIIMHSVLQYVPKGDVPGLFDIFRHCLKPGGRVLVSDVVSDELSFFRDFLSVFDFYMKRMGVLSFARFFFSELLKIRSRLGLPIYKYTLQEIKDTFARDFDLSFIPNPSISKNRLAFILRKPD